MQGIQLFEYKALMDYLQRLQEDAPVQEHSVDCEHCNALVAHEEKLKAIYLNYKTAKNDVANIIREFEEHKMAIRRLVAYRKHANRPLSKEKKE